MGTGWSPGFCCLLGNPGETLPGTRLAQILAFLGWGTLGSHSAHAGGIAQLPGDTHNPSSTSKKPQPAPPTGSAGHPQRLTSSPLALQ